MKNKLVIIFQTILIFLALFTFKVSAADRPAEAVTRSQCTNGTVYVARDNVIGDEASNPVSYSGVCAPPNRGLGIYNNPDPSDNRLNDYEICTRDNYDYYIGGSDTGCCPSDYNQDTLPGGGFGSEGPIICCPPSYTYDENVMGCFDGTNVWSAPASEFPEDANDTVLLGSHYVQKFSELIGNVPGARYVGESDTSYGCVTTAYYCPFSNDGLAGPSFPWNSAPNYNGSSVLFDSAADTPLGLEPLINGDAGNPRCQQICSVRDNNYCVPQIGWIRPTDDGIEVISPDGGQPVNVDNGAEAYEELCVDEGRVKAVLPSGIDRETINSSCGKIVDKSVVTEADQAEYRNCIACEFENGVIDESKRTGYIWTELQCISPTPQGIINRIFQIVLGITGVVIIFRIVQIVLILNTEEPSPERIAEVREILLSIVMFIVVTTGAVMLLRFVAVNLLQIPFLPF